MNKRKSYYCSFCSYCENHGPNDSTDAEIDDLRELLRDAYLALAEVVAFDVTELLKRMKAELNNES